MKSSLAAVLIGLVTVVETTLPILSQQIDGAP